MLKYPRFAFGSIWWAICENIVRFWFFRRAASSTWGLFFFPIPARNVVERYFEFWWRFWGVRIRDVVVKLTSCVRLRENSTDHKGPTFFWNSCTKANWKIISYIKNLQKDRKCHHLIRNYWCWHSFVPVDLKFLIWYNLYANPRTEKKNKIYF